MARATVFKSKSEAEKRAAEYQADDHARGLTERRWSAVPNDDPTFPWTIECQQDDPRHEVSSGGVLSRYMFGRR